MHKQSGQERLVRQALQVIASLAISATVLAHDASPKIVGWTSSVGPDERVSIDNIYDCILPLSNAYRAGIDWAVTLRVLPAFEKEPEHSVVITRAYHRGPVEARIITPAPVRIIKRFRELERRKGGEVTCKTLRNEVALRSCRVSGRQIGSLEDFATSLEAQTWPAVPALGIVFDATIYEARIQTAEEEARLSLQGPSGGRADERWHPFVRWAERLDRALAHLCAPGRP